MLVISNMYPSRKDPVYGTFVKDFVEGMKTIAPDLQLYPIVIAGRSHYVIGKIIKYCIFYTTILYRLLFHNYDCVYVHIITHAAIPLRIVSRFKSLPLVFNVHGEDVLTQTRLAGYFLKLVIPLLKQASFIVVPSDYFRIRFIEKLPTVPADRLLVSPSGGIDTDLFKPIENPKHECFTIGYVSRIDRGKGWDTFLKALSLVNQKLPVKAIIVGTGEEKGQFLKMIDTLGIKNVEYLGGIPHYELPSYYVQMDVFIFPTKLEESLGLVGLEAMACGVPVIGTRIGGLTDYIEENYNGYFFQKDDAYSLASKILQYHEISEEEKKRIRNNVLITAEKFSHLEVLTRLYHHLCHL